MKPFLPLLLAAAAGALLPGGPGQPSPSHAAGAPTAQELKHAADVAKKAAQAAHAAGEPPLQDIVNHLGYSTNVSLPEVDAQLFVKAGAGPVTFEPIAAFGLQKICSGGWYHPTDAKPQLHQAWQVDKDHNKQYSPPLAPGGAAQIETGDAPFGLYVATDGFPGEIVCSEDALQKYVPRFPANDHHKAHVFPAEKDGKVIPDAYIIGWEYSTNNDDQDMVTLVRGVKPVAPAAH